jgi:hypothetical protein
MIKLIFDALLGKPSLSSLPQLSGKYPSTAIGCSIVPPYKEFCIAALIFRATELIISKIGPPYKITGVEANLPHKLIVSFCWNPSLKGRAAKNNNKINT